MRRLGISELYSSLILLVIISTMGSIVYSYTLETTVNYEQHFSEQNSKELKRILERIELVDFTSINVDFNVSIYNYGEFNSSIDNIYINDIMVDNYYMGINENIAPYTILRISFASPVMINDGDIFNIKIVSSNGVVKSYDWEK